MLARAHEDIRPQAEEIDYDRFSTRLLALPVKRREKDRRSLVALRGI